MSFIEVKFKNIPLFDIKTAHIINTYLDCSVSIFPGPHIFFQYAVKSFYFRKSSLNQSFKHTFYFINLSSFFNIFKYTYVEFCQSSMISEHHVLSKYIEKHKEFLLICILSINIYQFRN